jgi:hypothetical protein
MRGPARNGYDTMIREREGERMARTEETQEGYVTGRSDATRLAIGDDDHLDSLDAFARRCFTLNPDERRRSSDRQQWRSCSTTHG